MFNIIQGGGIDAELKPLLGVLNNILQTIKDIKIPLNFEYKLYKEENDFMQKFIPHYDNPIIEEIATTTNNTLKNYFDNVKSYREDRKDIKNILGNADKYIINKNINNILKSDMDIMCKFIAIYNTLDMLSEVSEKHLNSNIEICP